MPCCLNKSIVLRICYFIFINIKCKKICLLENYVANILASCNLITFKILSRSNDYAKEVMTLCLTTAKKLPHILMNRCIRDPYVQWCERFSPLVID